LCRVLGVSDELPLHGGQQEVHIGRHGPASACHHGLRGDFSCQHYVQGDTRLVLHNFLTPFTSTKPVLRIRKQCWGSERFYSDLDADSAPVSQTRSDLDSAPFGSGSESEHIRIRIRILVKIHT